MKATFALSLAVGLCVLAALAPLMLALVRELHTVARLLGGASA